MHTYVDDIEGLHYPMQFRIVSNLPVYIVGLTWDLRVINRIEIST